MANELAQQPAQQSAAPLLGSGAITPGDRSSHWLFYDGQCGLCHGAVKWVLPRDRAQVFLFAPLGGESFQERIPRERHHDLPDSIVLLTPTGELLAKSHAVSTMLKLLGPPWRAFGSLLSLVPRPLCDWGYDFIAKIRHHLFEKPDDVCPVVPPEFRSRFRP